MAMKNAFEAPDTEEGMDMEEDSKETSGVVLVFSKADAKKIMEHCDAKGISYEEDSE